MNQTPINGSPGWYPLRTRAYTGIGDDYQIETFTPGEGADADANLPAREASEARWMER